MVAHPSEYPWSSYRHNALGQPNELVTPHLEYRRLGKADEERQAAYRQLFKSRIPKASLTEIREATNKAWVLGNDRFKQHIQGKLDRRAEPKAR
jgi:putative transposase